MLTSATELLKKSVNLYLNNFTAIFKYLLLTLIPTVIFVFAIWLPKILGGGSLYATMIKFWWLFALAGAVVFLLIFILGMLFYFNLMRIIKKIHRGETLAPAMETTKETEKVLWKGIGVSLLAGLYTAGPFIVGALLLALNRFAALLPFGFLKPMSSGILLAVAGIISVYGAIHAIIFSIKLFPAMYESVLAEKSPVESVKNSFALTKDRWSAILGRLLLTGIAVWIVYLLASLILAFILKAMFQIFGASTGIAILANNIFMQALSILITPVPLAVGIILYEELKKLEPAPKV